MRSGTLIITIIDINDNAPEFTELTKSTSYSVEENSDPNRLIGNAIATDKDSEINANVSYRIEPFPNLKPDMIAINQYTGEIRTGVNAKQIDCEEFQQQNYTVYASDSEHETNITITINIIDQNDEIPKPLDYIQYIEILENTEEYNITTIKGFDRDFSEPFRTITYLFNDEEDDNKLYFNVVNDTGLVYVNLSDTKKLDREEKDEYQITFLLRDNFAEGRRVNSNPSEQPTTVTVKLLDENDEYPEFYEKYTCFISADEDQSLTSPFFDDVLAKDDDEPGNKNSHIHYRIHSLIPLDREVENAIELFKIITTNETEGRLQIWAKRKLVNLWGQYNLTLTACDRGEVPNCNDGSFIVCINDTNDNDPKIIVPRENERFFIFTDQPIDTQLMKKDGNRFEDFEASDDDDPRNGNGQVIFNIIRDENAQKYFRIVNGEINTGQLRLQSRPPDDMYSFLITIQASDQGNPPRHSPERNITIIRTSSVDFPPVFANTTQTLSFQENKTGISAKIEPATDANNNGMPEDMQEDIFYSITAGNNEKFFHLDEDTGTLEVIKELDYELYHHLSLTIQAHSTRGSTLANPDPSSVLDLRIEIIDINDNPPHFKNSLFPGSFSTSDPLNKTLVTLEAEDKDQNDSFTYLMLKETIKVTDSSLEEIKDRAVSLVGSRILLSFDPANRALQGYFEFTVVVKDSMVPPSLDHEDRATVQIHIISSVNIVKFNFFNTQSFVEDSKNDINNIFKDVLGYLCTVDNVNPEMDSNGLPLDTQTVVDAHFLNLDTFVPIEKNQIVQKITDFQILSTLKQRLMAKSLVLADYNVGSSTTQSNLQEYLQIVLICVSSVLGIMVVVLFVSFFIRIRTLNKRLEKLSMTKFGSQDSGLNRIGVAVPNTNRHAVEGSNPVWNEDMHPEYDNMSQGSGDSDLIGIEDNPEFNPHGNSVDNAGYNPDNGRRGSVNPLSNQMGDFAGNGGRRGSVNPLSSSLYDNDDPAISIPNSNSNFTFRKANSIPSTEL